MRRVERKNFTSIQCTSGWINALFVQARGSSCQRYFFPSEKKRASLSSRLLGINRLAFSPRIASTSNTFHMPAWGATSRFSLCEGWRWWTRAKAKEGELWEDGKEEMPRDSNTLRRTAALANGAHLHGSLVPLMCRKGPEVVIRTNLSDWNGGLSLGIEGARRKL